MLSFLNVEAVDNAEAGCVVPTCGVVIVVTVTSVVAIVPAVDTGDCDVIGGPVDVSCAVVAAPRVVVIVDFVDGTCMLVAVAFTADSEVSYSGFVAIADVVVSNGPVVWASPVVAVNSVVADNTVEASRAVDPIPSVAVEAVVFSSTMVRTRLALETLSLVAAGVATDSPALKVCEAADAVLAVAVRPVVTGGNVPKFGIAVDSEPSVGNVPVDTVVEKVTTIDDVPGGSVDTKCSVDFANGVVTRERVVTSTVDSTGPTVVRVRGCNVGRPSQIESLSASLALSSRHEFLLSQTSSLSASLVGSSGQVSTNRHKLSLSTSSNPARSQGQLSTPKHMLSLSKSLKASFGQESIR